MKYIEIVCQNCGRTKKKMKYFEKTKTFQCKSCELKDMGKLNEKKLKLIMELSEKNPFAALGMILTLQNDEGEYVGNKLKAGNKK